MIVILVGLSGTLTRKKDNMKVVFNLVPLLFYRVGEGTDKSLNGIPGHHRNNVHENIDLDLAINGGHSDFGNYL